MSKNKRPHRRPAPFQGPFGRASSARSQQLTATLEEARALLLDGQTGDAAALLEDGLPRFGNHPPYRVLLATAYGELGMRQEAAVHAQMAVDLAPQVADYQLLAVVSLYEAGYYTLAHRARQALLRLATPVPAVSNELALQEKSYQAGLDDLCDG